MNRPIITLCASAAFYEKLLEIERELKKRGFVVKVPSIARSMAQKKDFDVDKYKSWLRDASEFAKKRKLMDEHFRKVITADSILVINLEKSGIKGYIGGNVLMEMVLAYHYKKPIFILNEVSPNLPVYEEVYGLQPVFLNGDIQGISLRRSKKKHE